MKIFDMLFMFVSAFAAFGNAYSLYNGGFDKAVMGWIIAGILFLVITLEKAKQIWKF